MLTVICGEDNVKSRSYLNQLLTDHQKKNFEVQRIVGDQLHEILPTSSQAVSLFGQKKIFVIENLSKLLSRKKSGKIADIIEKIQNYPQVELIDWEDSVSKREIKIKNATSIKEFRPEQNIFQLLEACYPTNLRKFQSLLNTIGASQSETFVFIMLVRHIRSLLLVKLGASPSHLYDWQKRKLLTQANQWNVEKLTSFYDKLLAIELAIKSGRSVYSISKSLEVLSCYYL